jgi:3-oxoacyl-[acyl-carrier protein] reductase
MTPSVSIDLSGRVAFVTGSTRGIGWGIAEAMASAGATVVLNGHGDEALLAARARTLTESHGVRAFPLFGDVSDVETTKTFYATIWKTFGRLDVLVNNAGIMRGALIGMIDDTLIDAVVRTNVVAVIRNLQAAARLIGRNAEGGSIVNLSSIVGTCGSEGQLVYSASKAAVVGLTLSAAKELAAKNIRVNAIAPGLIETDMVSAFGDSKLEDLKKSIRMRRAGTPADVASVALFLASDLSRYVTGQVIGVDGAMRI